MLSIMGPVGCRWWRDSVKRSWIVSQVIISDNMLYRRQMLIMAPTRRCRRRHYFGLGEPNYPVKSSLPLVIFTFRLKRYLCVRQCSPVVNVTQLYAIIKCWCINTEMRSRKHGRSHMAMTCDRGRCCRICLTVGNFELWTAGFFEFC